MKAPARPATRLTYPWAELYELESVPADQIAELQRERIEPRRK